MRNCAHSCRPQSMRPAQDAGRVLGTLGAENDARVVGLEATGDRPTQQGNCGGCRPASRCCGFESDKQNQWVIAFAFGLSKFWRRRTVIIMREDGTSALLRALARPGGNPYAFIQDGDDQAPSEERKRVTGGASAQHAPAERQGDLFRLSSVGLDMAKQPSGNPYASLANPQEEALPVITNVAESLPAALAVTKAAFRSECTRIFRQYIPPAERGRLREYMRRFISRNESRPATVRALLLRALARFDLSDLCAVPQFNREDESLSEQKLREIERSVGPEK